MKIGFEHVLGLIFVTAVGLMIYAAVTETQQRREQDAIRQKNHQRCVAACEHRRPETRYHDHEGRLMCVCASARDEPGIASVVEAPE
jgi:hypothetical protein